MEISTIPELKESLYNFLHSSLKGDFMIDYSPLWQTMRERNVSQYQLLKSGIDNKTLDSLKKNKNITLLTVERLCRIINCTPNDIVQFIEQED